MFHPFLYGRDLSYNKLTGEIPFNIGFLQVATLYVLCNFCDTLGFCCILSLLPFDLRITFIFVRARSLQGNQLFGDIPSVIGLMQALAVL